MSIRNRLLMTHHARILKKKRSCEDPRGKERKGKESKGNERKGREGKSHN